MGKRKESKRNWLVGTINMDGYKIPVVGHGNTIGEAQEEALQRVNFIWANHIEPEEELDQDKLTLSTLVGD
jgi:hypothetical protein